MKARTSRWGRSRRSLDPSSLLVHGRHRDRPRAIWPPSPGGTLWITRTARNGAGQSAQRGTPPALAPAGAVYDPQHRTLHPLISPFSLYFCCCFLLLISVGMLWRRRVSCGEGRNGLGAGCGCKAEGSRRSTRLEAAARKRYQLVESHSWSNWWGAVVARRDKK